MKTDIFRIRVGGRKRRFSIAKVPGSLFRIYDSKTLRADAGFFLNTDEKITVVHFLPQNLSNQTQPIYTKATHIFAKFVAELTAMCMVGLELLERLCALSILRVSFAKNYG